MHGSRSDSAFTFLITEVGGRARVGCFAVCLSELMAAPSLTFKASNAAFQAAPAGERSCGRKLSRLKCHVRLETRGRAGASTCLRSTPISQHPPSCLVAKMSFPRRPRDISVKVCPHSHPLIRILEYHLIKAFCFKFIQGDPKSSLTPGHRYGYLRQMIACPSMQMAVWEVTLQAACTET